MTRFDVDILMLRHGETEWNRQERMQGHLDSPLTELGVQQAQAQAKILASLDLSGRDLYCSPLGRARKTAEIALPGAAFQFDPRLREIGAGSWEGRTRGALEAELPIIAQMSYLERFSNAPGGEGLPALTARVSEFLTDLNGPALVVAHGVTLVVMRGLLLGLGRAGMEALDRPQGVVLHIKNGREWRL